MSSVAENYQRAERIGADIEAIAGFSEVSPERGYSRPTFSDAWKGALEYVIAQATEAGAEHVIDAAGNLHVRHASIGWDRPVWLSGSHLDSVPSGGKYDGVTGVVVPLEIIRSRPELPLELIVFAEEEGTTFNMGLLGSRLWAGTLAPDVMTRIFNRHGRSAAEAGIPHGLQPERLATGSDWTARLHPTRYYGMIEIHPEQGLSLWDSQRAVAAVDRINGRRQLQVCLRGQANHAGSTGMVGRRDALTGAAEIILELEKLGRELDRKLPYTVLTVGELTVSPGATNVIPGDVSFSVDFRGQEEELLLECERSLETIVVAAAKARKLEHEISYIERLKPSPLSTELCTQLQEAAVRRGTELPVVPSGALHDAAVLAPLLPTAMIFVASRDGISHNPTEYSRLEDIVLAADILEDMIRNAKGQAHES